VVVTVRPDDDRTFPVTVPTPELTLRVGAPVDHPAQGAGLADVMLAVRPSKLVIVGALPTVTLTLEVRIQTSWWPTKCRCVAAPVSPANRRPGDRAYARFSIMPGEPGSPVQFERASTGPR